MVVSQQPKYGRPVPRAMRVSPRLIRRSMRVLLIVFPILGGTLAPRVVSADSCRSVSL